MPEAANTCAACQFTNPPGARFCAGCGQALAARCSQCGQDLVPGGGFCPGCGTAVSGPPVTAAPSAPPGPPAPVSPFAVPETSSMPGPAASERRLVTILFADIVGSTSLGEAIDPEDLADIINGGFEVMTRAVAEAGGYIARLMGDGLLAFFGAPVSHEDDHLRAVRAALAIRDGVVAYGQDVAAAGGPSLGVRVGLDSGRVVVGQVGSELFSEYTTMGDAANTAARLQGAAPPNEVLLSEATARLIGSAVPLDPFGPLSLKGKAEPVPAFRVSGPAPEPGAVMRGLAGVATPLVGREGELARLLGLFDDALAGRQLTWVTVVADAGVGKSRLLAAVLEAIGQRGEAGLTLLRGRSVEQDTGAPYSLIRSLLASRFPAPAGGLAAARDSIRVGLAQDLGGLARLPGLLAMDPERSAVELARLVLPDPAAQGDPRGQSERALATLVAWLRGLGSAGPVALALEDLHWADDASLDALARLAAGLVGLPVLILGNSRPELFSRRPLWGEGQAGHLRLSLTPLSPAATARLLVALLDGDAPPDEVAQFVTERSEGNPYFVEELVSMLLARSMLVREGDGWRADLAALEEGRVPTTLQGMLQARLDRLAAAEKDALQRASVLGRVFWTGALPALGVPDPDVVDTLRGRGMVYAREQGTFPGEREWVFQHALLRDAAYASLLRKTRPTLHGAAADWLYAAAGDRYGEFASQIARHCAEAGRAAEAGRHYLAAGDQALSGYANVGAIDFYTSALAHLPPDGTEDRFAALKGRELAADMLGRREAQRNDLEALTGLAAGLPGPAASYVHFRRSWLAHRTGDVAGAETEALAAIATAGEDGAARADGLVNLGNALLSLERWAEAREQFEAARALRQSLGEPRGAAIATLGAANAAEELGDFAAAMADCQDALATFRQLDDLGFQAKTLTNLGVIMARQGDLEAAAPHFDLALHLYRAAGDRVGEWKALGNIGYLAAQCGDHALAEVNYLEAVEVCRAIQDRAGERKTLLDLEDLYRSTGRGKEAAAAKRQAAALGKAS